MAHDSIRNNNNNTRGAPEYREQLEKEIKIRVALYNFEAIFYFGITRFGHVDDFISLFPKFNLKTSGRNSYARNVYMSIFASHNKRKMSF